MINRVCYRDLMIYSECVRNIETVNRALPKARSILSDQWKRKFRNRFFFTPIDGTFRVFRRNSPTETHFDLSTVLSYLPRVRLITVFYAQLRLSLSLARTTKSHLTSRSDDLNIIIIDDDASQAFPTLRRSGTPLARLEIIGERGSPLDFPFSRSGLSRTHARFIPPPLGFWKHDS